MSVDVRSDRRTGALHVLDVNPRLGACFRLFTTVGGLDVVRAMYRDLTGGRGGTGPPSGQVDGRTYVVESYDRQVLRAYGLAGRRAWRHQVRRAGERAWWSPDDPLPSLAFDVQSRWGEPRPPAGTPSGPVAFR